MIGFVKGTLEESRVGKVVVDVNGFGINVIVSEAARESLPSVGNGIKLYTYTSVREDGISLYGFVSRDELDLFNLLIGVSGVGPKGAQALLGAYTVSMIKYYIVSEDVKSLSAAPTIGKKTAERIIVDLKDKVNKEDTINMISDISVSDKNINENMLDAIEALVALGYDRKQSKEAVSKIENVNTMDTNDILKDALKFLF